jgi:hypothetical protein
MQVSGWLASFNAFKLNDRFSVHFDAQLRSTDQLEHVQTLLLRPGVNYHFKKNWIATAGYAHVHNKRNIGAISNYLAEQRAWQQLVYNHKWRKISIAHRLRFEQRFIPKAKIDGAHLIKNGTDKAYRLRYFIRNIIPLTDEQSFSKGLFFALQNEVFINTGDKSAVNGHSFDQNRFYPAIGYRLPQKLDIEIGYMNQYSKTVSSSTVNHIGQIAVYKRL